MPSALVRDPSREQQHAIYLDNASTSHPKPDAVWESIREYLRDLGASPGRGGYASARRADAAVEAVREALAFLMGVPSPVMIAFTNNATTALNTVIHGCLGTRRHVVTTSAEHNSVLRPLTTMQSAGLIEYDVVALDSQSALDTAAFVEALRPDTGLVVINHASNVSGAVLPVEEVTRLAHERDIPVLLDASQTAGLLDINIGGSAYDFVAFTGHKALQGPSGTGGLVVRDPATLRSLVQGGTGSISQSLLHPEAAPTKFEAGTINYLGIAGLGAACSGVANVRASRLHHELTLLDRCAVGLRQIPGVQLVDLAPGAMRVPILSFTVVGLSPGEVSALLDDRFGIMTRAGLHCAPLMHQSLGTVPNGSVRISLGPANTAEDIDRLIEAVTEIAASDESAATRSNVIPTRSTNPRTATFASMEAS